MQIPKANSASNGILKLHLYGSDLMMLCSLCTALLCIQTWTTHLSAACELRYLHQRVKQVTLSPLLDIWFSQALSLLSWLPAEMMHVQLSGISAIWTVLGWVQMHFCLFPAPQSDLIIALQGCKVSILHDTTNKMLLICSPLLSFPVSQKLSAELMGRNPEHHSLLLTKCAGFESVLAQDLRVEKGYQVHPLYLGVHAYHDKLPNPTREEAVRKETITPHLVSVP